MKSRLSYIFGFVIIIAVALSAFFLFQSHSQSGSVNDDENTVSAGNQNARTESCSVSRVDQKDVSARSLLVYGDGLFAGTRSRNDVFDIRSNGTLREKDPGIELGHPESLAATDEFVFAGVVPDGLEMFSYARDGKNSQLERLDSLETKDQVINLEVQESSTEDGGLYALMETGLIKLRYDDNSLSKDAMFSSGGLLQRDITRTEDGSAQVEATSIDTSEAFRDFDMDGENIYIAGGSRVVHLSASNDGLELVNEFEPAEERGFYDLNGLSVAGDKIIVSAEESGIYAIEKSESGELGEISMYLSKDKISEYTEISDVHAYSENRALALSDNSMKVIGLSGSNQMNVIGGHDVKRGGNQSISTKGEYAYVGSSPGKIEVFKLCSNEKA